MAHLHTKFGAKTYIQTEVIDIFRNARWRPLPSWIFTLCEFGTFRGVGSLMLELYTKFGS